MKPRLDEVTINRWKHLFGIEELCPTLSHIHKADGVEVQSVKTLSKLEKEVLTEVLGESELTKRIDLINFSRRLVTLRVISRGRVSTTSYHIIPDL